MQEINTEEDKSDQGHIFIMNNSQDSSSKLPNPGPALNFLTSGMDEIMAALVFLCVCINVHTFIENINIIIYLNIQI